jgi:hypothetical protein
MAWLENVVIKEKELTNERLELTDKGSLYFLGPDLTLRNCTVVLKVSARNLLFRGARFIDCTFDVRQELKNHQDWIAASIQGCRFKGRFNGCDFGHWPSYSSDPHDKSGSIADCDFTEARLDSCRFIDCDPTTLRLPRWPCFTILDPLRRSAELARMPWPGDIAPVTMASHAKDPVGTAAVTYHAPSLAKDSGTTTEALRAVLETCAGVLY